jgi:hypothetical protein
MLKKYKSKYINVIEIIFENSIETRITFKTKEKEKTLWVPTPHIKDFFIERYKHLGINSTNIEDFIAQTDPKYKITKDDMEYFLDKYLFENVEKETEVTT